MNPTSKGSRWRAARTRIVRPIVPTLAVFDRTRAHPLDVDLDRLIRALRVFLSKFFVPIWGTPARLVQTNGFLRGAWGFGFFDSERSGSDDGFHDLTPEGLPFARIFVKNALEDDGTVTMTASHELAEMLVDPSLNMECAYSERVFYDYEVADPVEETSFLIEGLKMSNFVYPAWFEPFHTTRSTQFDHMGLLSKPFQIHRGGYARRFWGGKWKYDYGSHAKQLRFAREDRAGHRSTIRHARRVLRRSEGRHLIRSARS